MPEATIRHFTHADIASASSDSTAIQIAELAKRAHAMCQFDQNQPSPASPAWNAYSSRSGSQVIAESNMTNVAALPSTYSAREKGRDRYSGSAPLARSGATRVGPTHAVSRNAIAP